MPVSNVIVVHMADENDINFSKTWILGTGNSTACIVQKPGSVGIFEDQRTTSRDGRMMSIFAVPAQMLCLIPLRKTLSSKLGAFIPTYVSAGMVVQNQHPAEPEFINA